MAESVVSRKAKNSRPNIIFFLVDDLGWSDIGYEGKATYESPTTDNLAAQSMRFTQGYAAAPMCSPTRASIMTGQYPARLNLTAILPPRSFPKKPLNTPEYLSHLPLEEVTIAEQLSAAGYATAAIGKWHLGDEGYMADVQGFDTAIGSTPWGNLKRGDCGFFSPYCIPGFQDDPEGYYLTDRLTDDAEKWIEENKDNPFFPYMSHYAVHEPIQAKGPLVNEQKEKGVDNPKYGAMITSVDQSLARIVQKLRDLAIDDNTIIIFFSDNGGWLRETSNEPLRAGKGWLYEGGVRVPMFVHWPGVTNGGTVSDTPLSSVDFYPSILEMADIAEPIPATVDGRSFVPELRGDSFSRGPLFWHYPHYNGAKGEPSGAIRRDEYKLIEFFEDGGTYELYNIVDDPGENRTWLSRYRNSRRS